MASMLDSILKGLIGLAVLAFVLAILGSLRLGEIAGAPPEAFSRASTNLSLIAIALAVTMGRSLAGGPGR